MEDRVILHIDINHCFAQIEEMKNPSLRDVPMCVGGDEATRSGIVLARNLEAKKYGVKTAETLRDAYAKCPKLKVVPASYDDYIYYTSKIKEIYAEYSDRVESFGLDEAWVDVTHSWHLFGKKYDLARIIQDRVYDEYGITVSVGLSFNKIYAKLGSDLIKPSGIVIITPYNYKEVVWPLPVEDLLGIGAKTKPKLNEMGIMTIGDLANADVKRLEARFGIVGRGMWMNANGFEEGDVDFKGHVDAPKSIGNSTTPPSDINTYDEALVILQRLSESVAARLREAKMMGQVVSVGMRDVNLVSFSRQRKVMEPLNTSQEIMKHCRDIVKENYDFGIPLRSIGIHVSKLVDEGSVKNQMNLFETIEHKDEEKVIDETIEMLRNKFGFHTIKRASSLLNKEVDAFDAKNDNVVFPGRKGDYDTTKRHENKILRKKVKPTKAEKEAWHKAKGE